MARADEPRLRDGALMVMAASHPARWSSTARGVLGLTLSAVFLAVTLTRVDLGSMGGLSNRLVPLFIVLAAALSVVEVLARAVRWTLLLRPMAALPVPLSLAFLGIGHLANAVLPARLGDVARAYLAGGRLGVSRLSVLGTVATERVADASLLALVGVGAVTLGYAELLPAVAAVAVVGVIALALSVAAYVVLGRRAVLATRLGRLAASVLARFAQGAAVLRNVRSLVAVLLLTAGSFLLATLIMQATAAAVGLSIQPLQAALVIAAVTLSTAIPAGPASIGTYEFVGVTVMSAMGFEAEPAFVSVVLVHVIATLVPALIGAAGMWALGMKQLTPPRERAGG